MYLFCLLFIEIPTLFQIQNFYKYSTYLRTYVQMYLVHVAFTNSAIFIESAYNQQSLCICSYVATTFFCVCTYIPFSACVHIKHLT